MEKTLRKRYVALRDRKIAGAGLDVFEKEPPAPDNPLFKLDNVILTPHISAGTKDALVTKMRAAFANMVRVTKGEKPIHLVPY
jgi:phosphoglycerate dehydrogenase-like enzyme